MSVRDMTDEEFAAIQGMLDGNLEPLADLLDAENNDTHPIVHPVVHQYLLNMIRGTTDQTDYRLRAEKHPDLPDLRQGKRAKQAKKLESMEIAAMVAEHSELIDGDLRFRTGVEAAVADVMSTKNLGRATVMGAWGKHKEVLKHWAALAAAPEDAN